MEPIKAADCRHVEVLRCDNHLSRKAVEIRGDAEGVEIADDMVLVHAHAVETEGLVNNHVLEVICHDMQVIELVVLGSYGKLESLFLEQTERSCLDAPAVKSDGKRLVSPVERCAPRAEPGSVSVPWGDNCSLAGILAGDLLEEKVDVVRI